MNQIDIELYKTFCMNFDYNSWGEEYTRNNQPRLEDVFQKAKEKKIAIEISYEPMYPSSEWVWIMDDTWKYKIDYNPCLSLLSQTDETKTELLNLFE